MKKKIFSVIAAIFIFTCATYAQTAVSISDVKSPDDSEVLVPITTDKPLSGIGSLTFRIKYDDTVLDFNDEIINNALSGDKFEVNHMNGEIIIGWYNPIPISINDTLMVLKFGYKSGTSGLNFLENEITLGNGNQYPSISFIDGSVGPENIQIKLGSKISDNGDTVRVPLTAIALKNIGSLSLFIDYDQQVVDFIGLENNTYGITANASGNSVNVGWFDAINPITLKSGKLADLVFVVKSGKTDLVFNNTSEITNLTGDVLSIVYSDGFISDYFNQPAFLLLPTQKWTKGKQVIISVDGSGIKDLGSATLKISYDPAVLKYVGIDNLISGQLDAQELNGDLTIGYFNTSGLTLSNGKFVDLIFDYIDGSSSLTWNKTFGEITDVNGNPLSVGFSDGSIYGNNVPTLNVPGTQNINEGQLLTFSVSSDDLDGDIVSITHSNLPEGSKFENNNFSWTPTFNQAESYTITFTAKDNFGGEVNSDVLIVVNDVNIAPKFVSVLADTTINEGQSLEFQYTASDFDNDALTFALVGGPTGATMSESGLLKWTPEYDQAGVYDLVIASLTDKAVSVYDTAKITVVDVNIAPTFVNVLPDTTINEGQSLEFQYTGSDFDNDTLKFALVGGPTGAMMSESGLLKWTPEYDQAGVYDLIVASLTDKAVSVYDTAKITVVDVNIAPKFVSVLPDTTINEGQSLEFQYTASDFDNDALTFALVGGPTGAMMSESGLLKWTPDFDQAGVYDLIVASLTDKAVSVYDTAKITVTNVNRVPGFVKVLPDTLVKGGTTLAFTYTATDPDNDTLAFAKVSGPDALTVDSTGVLNWVIPISTSGVYTVVTSVSDGVASVLDTAVVTVQIGAYEVTIKQIQQPTDTTDVSPYNGKIVKTTGIVTAIDSVASGGMGYYIQDGAGAWNGIFVFTNKVKPTVKQGDKVTVTTLVKEYFNFTELDYSTQPLGLVIVSSKNVLPAVTKIKTGDDKEPYEGVLVKYSLAEVTNSDIGFGEWEINDGSGVAVADDQMFVYKPVLGEKLEITGVINYTFGLYAIEPRFAKDITASPEELITWFDLEAGSAKYFNATDVNTRGMAYNPTTGHVLIASRTGVPRIYVLDGITGAYLDTLDATGLADHGQYKVNQVVVADDGAIYSCAMVAFSFAANEFRVHRWADEDAVPTIAYSSVGTTRNGDVLSVSGSGVNTILYSSGSGSLELRKYTTTDGITFNLANTITLAAAYAGGGISPVSSSANANLWVTSGGQSVRLIDQTGAVLATIDGTMIPTYFWDVDYVKLANGKELLAVAGGNSNPGSMDMQVWDVTNLNNPSQVYYAVKGGTFNTNANATGVADIVELADNQFRVYHLLTNNGLALYANYEAPTYDMELASLDHKGGDLTVTMFNDGNIGYHDSNIGKGIEWKGVNGLWKGSIVYGRTSAKYAVGNAHNAVDFDDIVNVESYFNKGFTTWGEFDQVTYPVVLNDADAPLPYGIFVIQQSFSKTDENAVFIKYSFVNNTASAITDLYAGMFLDIDVGAGSAYKTNIGGYSAAEKLAYEYHDANNAYYGAVAITDGAWGARVTSSSLDDLDKFREAALTYISELPATFDDSPAGDQRTWIGSPVRNSNGSTSIAVGDTGYVVFALVAGDTKNNIRLNADMAFRRASKTPGWSTFVTDVNENLNVPSEFTLSQNYPNPFNPSTTIKFGLPSASQVKVRVFNILGETVDVLVNQDMSAGFHSINWNATNLSSGIYFYSIEAKSNEGGKSFSITKKMMLLK
ncbi:MAG: T9SS type A sorting domain-containing protein [Bacteroidetes bacterium]|nr:T9SS type A sorting domain-containing protein [Bacteroidota bacterium]